MDITLFRFVFVYRNVSSASPLPPGVFQFRTWNPLSVKVTTIVKVNLYFSDKLCRQVPLNNLSPRYD